MTEATKSSEAKMTIGLDIGDRKSTLCTLDSEGAVIERGEVATNKQAMTHQSRDGGRSLESRSHPLGSARPSRNQREAK